MKTVHITLTMPLKWPKLFTFWRLVTFANIFWDLATFQRSGSKFSQTKLMFFSSQRILKLIKKWRLTLVFVFKRRLIVDHCYFWLYIFWKIINWVHESGWNNITLSSLIYAFFRPKFQKDMALHTVAVFFAVFLAT